MAVNFLIKRSNVASKRPTAAQLDIGELSLNYESTTPGLFFEDSAGGVRKIGPVEVSASAPNSSPAGSTGNSTGELWFDTGTNNLKIWTGAAFAEARASVATLTTTRTIWGQNFNGSANVSGALSGATTISASSDISLGGELNFTTASAKYVDFYTDNDAGVLSAANLRLVNNASNSFHNAIVMQRGGAVTLYHNNSSKLATSANGVDITGTLTVTSSTLVTNLNADSVDGKSFGTFTAAGGVLYATSTTAASGTAAGTAGQALLSAGASAPVWTTLTLENLPDAAFKRSVRVATTADLGASTFAAGVLTGFDDVVVLNVDTTISSTTATTTSTVGLKPGAVISGNANIPAATTVASITNATTFVMSAAATATATAVSTTFTQTIAALAVDGITLALNDRVLVKNQTSAAQNGIYYLSTLGSATVPWVLTRTTDADAASELGGAVVNADSGAVNGGFLFDTDFKTTDTLNTSAMVWSRIVDTGLGNTTAATIAMNGVQAAGTSDLYARADHVHPTDTSRAPLASPTFTGTPAAPTAAVDTNTTQLATTAFVVGQASATNPLALGTVAVGTSLRYARQDHVHPTTGLGLTSGTLAQFAATTSAQLAGVISDETGSGALVFAASPTLSGTPLSTTAAVDTNTTQIATTAFVVGQASATNPLALGTVAIGTSLRYARQDHVHPTTGLGLTSGTLAQFAATSSSQLAGVISDETGSGALVFATSPTLVTPLLGTPTSGNLSNCTNIPAGQLSGTIPSGVLGNSSLFIGTTSIALNRASAAIALTGITSIDGDAASVDGKSFGTFTAAGGVLYATSTTAASGTAAGTAGQALLSAGASAPVWTTLTLENLPDAAFKRSVRAATTADVGASTFAAGVLTGFDDVVVLNVSTTLSSTTATTTSTAGLKPGAVISGNANIPAATTIASITNATTFVMSAAATATAASISTTFTQTITALAVDGITLALNDRVLVKNQTSTLQNGIYYLSTLGSATVPWVLTRALDADTSSELGGGTVNVDSGTTQGGQLWTTSFKTTDTLNTTAMNWYLIIDTSSANSTAATIAMNGVQAAGSSNLYARADHVHPSDTSRAPLASPTFTGTPAAPTAAVDTNTTQIATTAFVVGQASATNPLALGTVAIGTSLRYARQDHVHPTTGLGLTGSTLAQFAATTSAQLAGVISDETGSGALVFATSPTLVTPVLGTPTSGNLSNCTNVPAGQLSGTIPSAVLGNSSLFIGTTSIALNRASAAQSLTGITSIDGSAATLTTTRTLWGQNFNGSANVTGSLTSVGDITGSGAVTLSSAAASALNLTAGTTGAVTVDSGSTGAVNIGNNANAKTITIGNVTGATTINVNSGTGGILVTSPHLTMANQGEVRFREQTANGTNFIGLEAPASVAADLTFLLPGADGTTTSGYTLKSNGSAALSFGTANIVTSDTAPASPLDGDLWYNSANGRLFIYYADGTTNQWVDASPDSSGVTNIRILDSIAASFNGTTATFNLTVSAAAVSPVNAQQLLIVVGGVVQMAGTHYTVSGSTITFTAGNIPTSGLTFYGVIYGDAATLNTIADGAVTTAKIQNSSVTAAKLSIDATVLPTVDNSFNLGSASFRFANIFTGDLHLKNDRGDWTIIEEEDCLTMRNNKTGKVYDIMMKERSAQ